MSTLIFSRKGSIGSLKTPQINNLNNTKPLENEIKSSEKSEILVSDATSVNTSGNISDLKESGKLIYERFIYLNH